MNEQDERKPSQDQMQAFLELYSEYQHRIYGFIMSFVGDWNEADDIYQETQGVLWRKFEHYVPGTDFLSWSFKIAHFQILSYMKKKKTLKKYFCQASLENLGEVAVSSSSESDMSIDALRKCVKKLPEKSRKLLSLRYQERASVSKIALRLQLSANTLYKTYHKIHAQLFQCVRRQLGWELSPNEFRSN